MKLDGSIVHIGQNHPVEFGTLRINGVHIGSNLPPRAIWSRVYVRGDQRGGFRVYPLDMVYGFRVLGLMVLWFMVLWFMGFMVSYLIARLFMVYGFGVHGIRVYGFLSYGFIVLGVMVL